MPKSPVNPRRHHLQGRPKALWTFGRSPPKTLRTGGFIVWEDNIPKDFGEWAGNLVELAAWRKDPRFVPFFDSHIGAGPQSERGLELIGEPALNTVLARLDEKHDGWSSQEGAIAVLKAWLKEPYPFLKNGSNRQLVKQHLIQRAQREKNHGRRAAIDALRYINEPDVIVHLTAISRNEILANNVRASARASLEYLKNR